MKILTLNTWQERGPWRLRWDLIFQWIEENQPELICFQEVFNADWAQEVKAKTGYPYLVFHPEHSGLMILSQRDINSSACYTMKTKSPTEDYQRYVLFAEIKMGKQRLGLFNTHLSWKLDEGAVREKQVGELISFVGKKSEGAEVFICGDFNAPPSALEIQKMSAKGNFIDAYGITYPGAEGFTWNNENPYVRNCTHPMPDRRIDYIFYQSKGAAVGALKEVKIVMNKPAYTGIWPSDHFGLSASFESAAVKK